MVLEHASIRRTKIFMQNEGMIQLCQGLGMPGDLITEEVVTNYVPSCFVEVYLNGELQTHHAPLQDRRLVNWFGERDFCTGQFVQHLAELRDGKRHIDGVDIVSFQRAMAALFARKLANGEVAAFEPGKAIPPSPVRIEGADVIFGGNFGQGEYREQLSRPIKYALALDPGIRAIHVINGQLRILATEPASLFQYSVINRHPFIAELLVDYLISRCRQLTGDDQLAHTLIENNAFVTMYGDIATETRHMIEREQQLNQTAGYLDLVIFAHYMLPQIDVTSTQNVLENVYQLLSPGGALLLGFPLVDGPTGRANVMDLMQAAKRSGFSAGPTHIYAGASNMSNLRFPLFSFWVK